MANIGFLILIPIVSNYTSLRCISFWLCFSLKLVFASGCVWAQCNVVFHWLSLYTIHAIYIVCSSCYHGVRWASNRQQFGRMFNRLFQLKNQESSDILFNWLLVKGIHRLPVGFFADGFPSQSPVMRKPFHCDDSIMCHSCVRSNIDRKVSDILRLFILINDPRLTSSSSHIGLGTIWYSIWVVMMSQ